jgi:hypothetical protein
MKVGGDYTIDSFINEAREMGVSKKINFKPDNFEVGKSWVFLFKDIGDEEGEIPGKRNPRKDVIFYVFRPTRIEYIVSESKSQDEFFMAELEEKGFTPVIVPDNDPAHKSKKSMHNYVKKELMEEFGDSMDDLKKDFVAERS